ncbi:MAG TPA: AraC family transcriptional regulator [Pyrinomonadaceae bacterium]
MNELSSVVSKRKASWDGIKLEHYRFRRGELPEHTHQEHLITFSLTGCNGLIRTASGFQARGESEESVCVIPSGHPFSAQLGGDSEQLAIYLDPALVLRAADDSRTAGGHAVEVIEGCSTSDPIVKSVGLALLSELESEGLSGRLYVESLANVLAVHLLRRYTAARGSASRFKGGLSGRKQRRVMAFIADNYESDLSLAEMAGAAGMSAFHFAREFKRTTGSSPHQYLINFRVERAKSLLTESELPLVEVSSRSGFSHQSHFTRLFRRLTGMTPQSYRLTFQP